VRVNVVGIDMIDVSIVVNVYVLVWELLSMMHFVGSLVSVIGTSSVLVQVLVEVLVDNRSLRDCGFPFHTITRETSRETNALRGT